MKPDLGNRAAFTWLSLHPLSTSLIVIVMGHHFVSDVAIGAGVALVLPSLTTHLSSRRHRRPPFGGPETRGDMTFGGPAITLSPDDQTVSVLHTETETTTTRIHRTQRSHEQRPPTTPTDDPAAAFDYCAISHELQQGTRNEPCPVMGVESAVDRRRVQVGYSPCRGRSFRTRCC
jgi:hypothetical protein